MNNRAMAPGSRKKILRMLLLFIALLFVSIRTYAMSDGDISSETQEEEIAAILAARNKQPHPTFTTKKDSLDTVWVLFANGDFVQYVTMDDELRIFSRGTYSRNEDQSIHITRTQKYMEGAGLREYHSVHPYTLDPDAYEQLDADNPQVVKDYLMAEIK